MEEERITRRYRLQPQCFACEVAEGGVMLDLRGNEYIGLSRSQMRALSVSVQGWPCRFGVDAASDEAVREVTQGFVRKGFLSEDPAVGKDASPVKLPPLEDQLVEFPASERPPDVISYLPIVAACCASSLLLLRSRSLEHAVRRVERRKRRRQSFSAGFDWETARKLTQAFYWLNPLIYTARDHCLHESLALIEFLARYDLYPTWVIGVKAFAPFSAHSWVQHGGCAFTGSPEKLSAYVPILAV